MGAGTVPQFARQAGGVRRTAFITALAAEARTLRPAFASGADPAAANAVHIAVAGIGAAAAGKAAVVAMQGGADALVSWGFAGGLAPRLSCGTLVVAERIVCANGRVFATDDEWRAALFGCISARQIACCAPLLSVSAVLADAACKAQQFQNSGAVAVDMESAAVAQVARDWHVPFVAVRAVVDTASDRLPRSIADAIDGAGKLRWGRLCTALARAPRDVPSLLGLGSRYRIARRALRTAALAGRDHLHLAVAM